LDRNLRFRAAFLALTGVLLIPRTPELTGVLRPSRRPSVLRRPFFQFV